MKITPILWTYRKDKDNKCPIKIRISENYRKRYITLGIYIKENQWDGKRVINHEDASEYNAKINKAVSQAEIQSLELDGKKTTFKQIKDNYHRKTTVTFTDLANKVIEEYESSGMYGTVLIYRRMIKKVALVTSGNLDFWDIDYAFLKTLETKMRANGSKNNTILTIMNKIKALFNRAVKEDLVEYGASPFLKYSLKRSPVKKEKLSMEEVYSIESLHLSGAEDLARDMFLFSLYNAGIRFGDLCKMKWENIVDQRIVYSTSKSTKPISLKLSEKSLSILDKYINDSLYIFPLLKEKEYSAKQLRNNIGSKNAKINRLLKDVQKKAKINKSLSMHIARHSSASIMLEKGVSSGLIQKALGHSSLKTTEAYLKSLDDKQLDDAMEGLFD